MSRTAYNKYTNHGTNHIKSVITYQNNKIHLAIPNTRTLYFDTIWECYFNKNYGSNSQINGEGFYKSIMWNPDAFKIQLRAKGDDVITSATPFESIRLYQDYYLIYNSDIVFKIPIPNTDTRFISYDVELDQEFNNTSNMQTPAIYFGFNILPFTKAQINALTVSANTYDLMKVHDSVNDPLFKHPDYNWWTAFLFKNSEWPNRNSYPEKRKTSGHHIFSKDLVIDKDKYDDDGYFYGSVVFYLYLYPLASYLSDDFINNMTITAKLNEFSLIPNFT